MQAGAGRVLDTLASSSVPLRPASLAILLAEREKKDALQAYHGDLVWSILCSIHAMCKQPLKISSYSDMVDRIYHPKKDKPTKELTNNQVLQHVDDMLDMFLKGG